MNFTNYRHDDKSLRDTVVDYADYFGIRIRDWVAVEAMLAPLGAKREGGEFHRDHCYRVGLLCAEVAMAVGRESFVWNKWLHVKPKAAFYAGLLHDVGKALVPMCTLCATERWTEEDRRNMEPHVMDGFKLLRDRFDYTAHVIARHHKSQTGGYPRELPPLPNWAPSTADKIERCAEVLTLSDVFDAMHRVNSSSAGIALPADEIRSRMRAMFDPDLIDFLYTKEVLR